MKTLIKIGITLLTLVISQATLSAGFGTLFTTPSERQTIDDNRYKVKTVKKVTTVASVEKEAPKEIIYKIITHEYQISGVSIANNGVDSAWINGNLYESGDEVDTKITMTISGSKRKVRFNVKDGKTFFGQSGDLVQVSYKSPLFE